MGCPILLDFEWVWGPLNFKRDFNFFVHNENLQAWSLEEVALIWKFPYGILPKQTSKKFASEPPKFLRSPSRSGSMRKLVLALPYSSGFGPCVPRKEGEFSSALWFA